MTASISWLQSALNFFTGLNCKYSQTCWQEFPNLHFFSRTLCGVSSRNTVTLATCGSTWSSVRLRTHCGVEPNETHRQVAQTTAAGRGKPYIPARASRVEVHRSCRMACFIPVIGYEFYFEMRNEFRKVNSFRRTTRQSAHSRTVRCSFWMSRQSRSGLSGLPACRLLIFIACPLTQRPSARDFVRNKLVRILRL
jgi:hypothetical protein